MPVESFMLLKATERCGCFFILNNINVFGEAVRMIVWFKISSSFASSVCCNFLTSSISPNRSTDANSTGGITDDLDSTVLILKLFLLAPRSLGASVGTGWNSCSCEKSRLSLFSSNIKPGISVFMEL